MMEYGPRIINVIKGTQLVPEGNLASIFERESSLFYIFV